MEGGEEGEEEDGGPATVAAENGAHGGRRSLGLSSHRVLQGTVGGPYHCCRCRRSLLRRDGSLRLRMCGAPCNHALCAVQEEEREGEGEKGGWSTCAGVHLRTDRCDHAPCREHPGVVGDGGHVLEDGEVEHAVQGRLQGGPAQQALTREQQQARGSTSGGGEGRPALHAQAKAGPPGRRGVEELD